MHEEYNDYDIKKIANPPKSCLLLPSCPNPLLQRATPRGYAAQDRCQTQQGRISCFRSYFIRHRREVVLFNNLLSPELGMRVGTATCMWKEREGNEESESCSTQSWRATRRKGGDSEMRLVSAQWKRQSWCYHLWTI